MRLAKSRVRPPQRWRKRSGRQAPPCQAARPLVARSSSAAGDRDVRGPSLASRQRAGKKGDTRHPHGSIERGVPASSEAAVTERLLHKFQRKGRPLSRLSEPSALNLVVALSLTMWGIF